MMDNAAIIFGGSGFIGTHLTEYLLENNLASKIFCGDLVPPRISSDLLQYIPCDVRLPIDIAIPNVGTIYNLAAVHVTPGHPDIDYFETNIKGAENICNFATQAGIHRIVFTSSISPYGSSEDIKNEIDLPQPNSAYGISKLVAEYIHKCWLAESKEHQLTIVRPGVVFGKGEGGNFIRLYKSLKSGYFFYPGRKDTKKAAIYVKDLVRGLHEMSQSDNNIEFYNMCYPEPPTIQEIVKTICHITGVKEPRFVIPGVMLKLAAGILRWGNVFIDKNSGVHPDRVKKLMISTNISGDKLSNSSYATIYSLEKAIEDWYIDCGRNGLY
jgi:nucleoside-diphosphate-sugar epimerase